MSSSLRIPLLNGETRLFVPGEIGPFTRERPAVGQIFAWYNRGLYIRAHTRDARNGKNLVGLDGDYADRLGMFYDGAQAFILDASETEPKLKDKV